MRAPLPPGKGNQTRTSQRVAQAASGEALEAEVMVLLDRRIPLNAFMRLCEADHNIGKGKAVRRLGEEGSVIRAVAHAAINNRSDGKKPEEIATTADN